MKKKKKKIMKIMKTTRNIIKIFILNYYELSFIKDLIYKNYQKSQTIYYLKY
jgi:hypothetical protein